MDEIKIVPRAEWPGWGRMYDVLIPETQLWASFLTLEGQDPKQLAKRVLEEFRKKPLPPISS